MGQKPVKPIFNRVETKDPLQVVQIYKTESNEPKVELAADLKVLGNGAGFKYAKDGYNIPFSFYEVEYADIIKVEEPGYYTFRTGQQVLGVNLDLDSIKVQYQYHQFFLSKLIKTSVNLRDYHASRQTKVSLLDWGDSIKVEIHKRVKLLEMFRKHHSLLTLNFESMLSEIVSTPIIIDNPERLRVGIWDGVNYNNLGDESKLISESHGAMRIKVVSKHKLKGALIKVGVSTEVFYVYKHLEHHDCVVDQQQNVIVHELKGIEKVVELPAQMNEIVLKTLVSRAKELGATKIRLKGMNKDEVDGVLNNDDHISHFIYYSESDIIIPNVYHIEGYDQLQA